MKTKQDFVRLPETVEIKGVGIPGMTAKLIERTDKKAIYYRWDNVYEVIRIKIDEPKKVFENEYPRMEVYPTNEEFGTRGWCFRSYDKAKKRYDNLPIADN